MRKDPLMSLYNLLALVLPISLVNWIILLFFVLFNDTPNTGFEVTIFLLGSGLFLFGGLYFFSYFIGETYATKEGKLTWLAFLPLIHIYIFVSGLMILMINPWLFIPLGIIPIVCFFIYKRTKK